MPPKTVFVTGATGFIAKHIILQLLDNGYRVIGSVRSMDRAAEVRDAVAEHLTDAAGLDDRLDFAVLDLTRDEGWESALKGAEALIHTASPFPMTQPDDEMQVIRPAVDGALRALKAAQAAGVPRVVLTSSVVAVEGREQRNGRSEYDEADWTDVGRPGTTPYAKSKALAERAAWDFVKTKAPDLTLTVINPSLVLGPPLDRHYGTSIGLVERVLRAKDPMVPKIGFSVVDVRDVAAAHIRALDHDGSHGKRIIVSDRFLWMGEMAAVIKAAHPGRKIVTRRAPDFAVRLLGLFDKAIASIVPTLGIRKDLSHARAEAVLGLRFIDAEDAVRASANWLIRNTEI